MMAVHSLQLRKDRDPHFKIPPILQPVFDRCAMISPYMEHDRYLKPDYDQLLEYISSELPRISSVINADMSSVETATAMREAVERAKNITDHGGTGAAASGSTGVCFRNGDILLHMAPTPIS
ncbi:unnamed protein product, partial [Symbiodinium microadriaticum]